MINRFRVFLKPNSITLISWHYLSHLSNKSNFLPLLTIRYFVQAAVLHLWIDYPVCIIGISLCDRCYSLASITVTCGVLTQYKSITNKTIIMLPCHTSSFLQQLISSLMPVQPLETNRIVVSVHYGVWWCDVYRCSVVIYISDKM